METTAQVDNYGRPVSAVNGEGQTTEYERNAFGQVTKKTEPDPDGEGPPDRFGHRVRIRQST